MPTDIPLTPPGTSLPDYGHNVRLYGIAFDTARERLIEALRAEGFGVLTEIDVAATLREKLGVHFRPYHILGACNPQLAQQALDIDIGVGLVLPCNACVWGEEDATVVSILRPPILPEALHVEALRPMADEADRRLRTVIERLKYPAVH